MSIFNFHYATPPATVGMNYGLGKVIGDDETGFRGVQDRPYRIEAWDFLVAGGALFDNLDYSFTTDHEDGTARIVAPTPGGGGPGFRPQLQILKRFIEGFDFVKMAPGCPGHRPRRPAVDVGPGALRTGPGLCDLRPRRRARSRCRSELPAGRYRAEWLNPRTGKVEASREIEARGDLVDLASPAYEEDVALESCRRRRVDSWLHRGPLPWPRVPVSPPRVCNLMRRTMRWPTNRTRTP